MQKGASDAPFSLWRWPSPVGRMVRQRFRSNSSLRPSACV